MSQQESQRPSVNQGARTDLGLYMLREHLEPLVRQLQKQGVIQGDVVLGISEDADSQPVYTHPDFQFDRTVGEISNGSLRVHLTNTEQRTLDILCQTPNSFVSPANLFRGIYQAEAVIKSDFELSQINVHRVRDKIRRIGCDPFLVIETKNGKGVRLVDSSQPDSDKKQIIREKPKQETESVYAHPYFDFYPDRGMIKIDDDFIKITPRQQSILMRLFQKINRITYVHELEEELRSESISIDLRVQMFYLRAKLNNERELSEPIIGTAKGFGYVLLDFSTMAEKQKDAALKSYTYTRRGPNKARTLAVEL